ncbi:MAG TPA: hypothetical protein PK325_03915 [Cyclobacteriaceae bacterium]|nr:hypothetical protein [Cyclobacteriaceae bacterium]HMV88846.1 hypothetical protein [Cyclobacteriaceae bacterium]HMW99277.1 hypothetical protein [Cyclobacteriaceae bacterium]HMX48934.1 hypothetical protein [Cyclobacteriaceae bacterium]HMY94593.1 hypothetical protein [Cyclobacteriaceae bacterium]
MKKTLSAQAYFNRAKLFAYLMALSGLMYLFFDVFGLTALE